MEFVNEDIKERMPIASVAYIKNTPAAENLSFFLYIKTRINIKNIIAIILKMTMSNLKFWLLIAKAVK